MEPHMLPLDGPSVDLLTYALLCTIDDLEARAIIAEHKDADLGPLSAVEYRIDVRRLQTLLAEIAPDSRGPDVSQAAIQWLDDIYIIANGQPVRLIHPPTNDALESTPHVANSTDPVTVVLTTPQAAHRLAPGCQPVADHGAQPEARSC